MHRDLSEKSVVVTGGTGALGRAVVATLTGRGAHCWVPRTRSGATDAVDNVTFTGGVDLTSEDSVSGYYDELPEIWASIHLVGAFAMAPLLETTLADLERMWRLNVVTCFLTTRAAVAKMSQDGGGRIVNVTSRPGLTPAAGMVAYGSSKAAVVSLTATVAAEVVGDDILVNSVAPSIIDSEANRRAMPDADHASWPTADEIAEVIAFLASPENRLVSGATVPVYGKA